MDSTVGIIHLVSDLETVNRLAFSGEEAAMLLSIKMFNEKYEAVGLVAVRDENKQCYTAGASSVVRLQSNDY